jgi:crotonobetainyl-CoA:carnitine CoA-transferase CaiB-like acyl-CoA transferase
VPVAPVNTVEEALREELVYERKMIVEVAHEQFGPLKMLANPIKVSNHDAVYVRGPKMGEHNDEVYERLLRLSQEQLSALRDEKVI